MEQHQQPESKENYIQYFLLAYAHNMDDAFKAKQKLDTRCLKTVQWNILHT